MFRVNITNFDLESRKYFTPVRIIVIFITALRMDTNKNTTFFNSEV